MSKINTINIPKYVEIGKSSLNWYQDCQNCFVELFGAEKLELVCQLFAATSINTSLKSNITLFRKAYWEIENDKPIGRYLPNIQNQLKQIRNGDPLTGRKIRSFAAAMSGDVNAVVVDVWLQRAFGIEKKYWRQKKDKEKGRGNFRNAGVSDKEYTIIENWVREYSKVFNCEPRQLSAMIWAGVRIDTNGDKQVHYSDILKHSLQNLFNVI